MEHVDPKPALPVTSARARCTRVRARTSQKRCRVPGAIRGSTVGTQVGSTCVHPPLPFGPGAGRWRDGEPVAARVHPERGGAPRTTSPRGAPETAKTMKSTTQLAVLPLLLACSCMSTSAQRESARAWTDRLVDPLTAPTQFESPLVHTSVRPIAIHHELPGSSVFKGGDIQILAVQARYAVNDRLAIIATKDGYVSLDPEAGSSEDGWADLAAGAKYAVLDDPNEGVLVTAGAVLQLDTGETKVFQGNGSEILRPFVSAGLDLDHWNVLGNLGFDLPFDTTKNTTRMDYHLHADYEVSSSIYPMIELNGITYLDDAEAAPFDFEGGDFFNLGSNDVAGNTVMTGAIGSRFKFNDKQMMGIAYEAPLTSREDLFDWRVTVDFLWMF